MARTVAHQLYGDNVAIISFADALKNELDNVITMLYHDDIHGVHSMINNIDTSNNDDVHYRVDAFIDDYIDDITNEVIQNSRQRIPQVRSMLQQWGTSIRRHQKDSYWVNKFADTVHTYQHNGIHVVCDDVRFVNEAETIHELGGRLIRLEVSGEIRKHRLLLRDNNQAALHSDHPSETSLDNYNKFDIICRIVDTNATIEETTAGITTVLERGLYHE